MVFAGASHFAQAQMSNPLYNSKLTFGNWKTNIRFDSLHAGDTLVLKNDTKNTSAGREYQLNFTDSGKVTWYHESVNTQSTSLEIMDEWQQIGTWKKQNGNIYVETTIPEPDIPSKKNKSITFSIISESYMMVKLRVSTLAVSK
jgi:hypothetical protein